MTTLDTHRIASWPESGPLATDRSESAQSIATESVIGPNPEWDSCINALLDLWRSPEAHADGVAAPPSRNAIDAAIQWIRGLRESFPTAPPTLITCEPAGGIIMERRTRTREGDELIVEFTFYNNGTAESTSFQNGRVVLMQDLPFRP